MAQFHIQLLSYVDSQFISHIDSNSRNSAKTSQKLNIEKENNQHAADREKRGNNTNENKAPTLDSAKNKALANAAENFSNVLTERRGRMQYEQDDEDDSPEEAEEEEDEKENAMSKLKALLGSSKAKKKQSHSNNHHGTTLRKSSSYNERDNTSHDFLHIIDKMRRDLFYRLDIKNSSDEDDDEVSKIFYEGRDGQNYTINVLDQFFDSLKGKAKQLINHNESGIDKPKVPSAPKQEEDENVYPEEESDKDRIKRKLNESKKSSSKPVNNSNKESLKNLLNSTKPKKTPVKDINDVIKVDSQVLNYGVVNPGKLLGSILVISNTSDSEHTVEMSLDANTEAYDKEEITKHKEFEYLEELTNEEIELTEKEQEENLTEEKKNALLEKKKRFVSNSEHTSQCWFIENPKTKDLTKKITLKLGPKCEQEFIIVLKTLQPKFKNISLSFLNLELPEIRNDAKYNEKRIQKSDDDNIALTEEIRSNKLQVMLCGVVDPPNITCVKQVFDTVTKKNKVPIALKPVSGTQKFRIQFKNDGSRDVGKLLFPTRI